MLFLLRLFLLSLGIAGLIWHTPGQVVSALVILLTVFGKFTRPGVKQ
jgi:hypothetical protein